MNIDQVVQKIRDRDYESKLSLKGKDRVSREQYQQDKSALLMQFRIDALEAVGLINRGGKPNHLNAGAAFSFAYDQCHAGGFEEILYYLECLANLMIEKK